MITYGRKEYMMKFTKVEPSYTSKHGCRLVWEGVDEDDSDTVILNKDEFDSLVEILQKDSTGTVTLEDQVSTILVNSDVTQFSLQGHNLLEADTFELQKQVLEYAKIPHEPQYVYISSKQFYPSVWIRDDKEKKGEKSFRITILQDILPNNLSCTPYFILSQKKLISLFQSLMSLEYLQQGDPQESLQKPR